MATGTITRPQNDSVNLAREFRRTSSGVAKSLLRDWVGEERAKEAAGRISVAVSACAASARKPDDFYLCTPDSVARCVAIAALTEMMPGTGPTALAYLIPRRPRKGEAPQLQYQLSHRGLNALARRTGQTMIPVPISRRDELRFSPDGDVEVVHRDIDNPPTSEADLRGVIVLVRELRSGVTVCRGWVPVSIINKRREGSDSYKFALKESWAKETDPWHQWYVEMAVKTAMHYAISRGWCVIDDSAAVRAMSIDQLGDHSLVVPEVSGERRLADARSASDKLADMLEGSGEGQAGEAEGEQPETADAPEAGETAAEGEQGEGTEPTDEESPFDSHGDPELTEQLCAKLEAAKTDMQALNVLQDLSAAKPRLTEAEYVAVNELGKKRLDQIKASAKKK